MKNKNIKIALATALVSLLGYTANAQTTAQKIGTNPTIKDVSALLELEATNKGLLIPRVDLTSTTVAAPVTTPIADALIVYNKNTAGDVTPGFYYWNLAGLKWVRLMDANLSNNDWALLGNTGTNPTTNYLGTKDNQDMVFKVNDATKFIMPKTTNVNLLTAGVPSLIDSYLSSPLPIYYGGFTTFNTTHNIYSFSETGSSWGWNGAAASGTPAAPGIPVANALMSTTNGLMYDGTSFVNAARMRMHADGTPSATSLPSKITFWTTPVGSKVNAERLTIKNDGAVGINTAAPTNTLEIKSTTANTSGLTFTNLTSASPTTAGTAIGVDAAGKVVTIASSASVQDLRLVGTKNHITQDAGVGGLGTNGGFSDNVFIGSNAGFSSSNISGQSNGNIGIGTDALKANKGVNNVNIGNGSSVLNEDGSLNTVVGGLSFSKNTSGSNNTTLGHYGLVNNTTGSNNTAFGAWAGNNISTGSGNIAIGHSTYVANATANNQLTIGNLIYGTGLDATFNNISSGNIGIGVKAPLNRLHVVATANPLRLEGLQAGAVSDNFVVVDGDGVVKTVAASSITGTPVNIYNTNGTLTANRTVTLGGRSLTFTSPERDIYFDGAGRLANIAKGTNEADIFISSGTGSTYNRFDLQSFPNGQVNLTASGAGAEQLMLGTHATQVAAPLLFNTSAGGGALGNEKMRITGTGNVGVGESDPQELLDLGGTATAGKGGLRIRNINSAAYLGNASTDKVVVADAAGVLKTIAIPGITAPAIATKIADYTALAADETLLVNASAGAVTITLPTAVGNSGKKYTVKKIDASANAVNVGTAGGTIDGAATAIGTSPWQGWTFQSDGTNWYIVGKI